MKIKPQAAALLVLCIFIAGIAVTSALGLWRTTTSKIPAKLKDTQYAEAYDPADIRGSYTFSDISRLYGIPLEDLAAAFSVDPKAASQFQCKSLESIFGDSPYEIGTASVRMFAAYYLGLPYVPTEESYLPEAAAKILTEKGSMTPEQREDLNSHTAPAG
jgi:hypothetical protein